MLAFAHDVADIAEDKEIAGHSARQAAGIVGISGDKACGKPAGKMRRGAVLAYSRIHPLQEIVGERNVPGLGKIDEARGKARVVCVERGLDLLAHDTYTFFIPQGRTDLKVG